MIEFKKTGSKDGSMVVTVYEDNKLSKTATLLNEKTQGTLLKALSTSTFKGKKGDFLVVVCPHGVDYSHIVLVGLGNVDEQKDFVELGGKIYAAVSKFQNKQCTVVLDSLSEVQIAQVASGAELRSWRFDKYKTKKKEPPMLETITFIVNEEELAKNAFEPLHAVNEGVFLTRHVVSEPPNVLYPVHMSELAKELEPLGVKVEILGEKDMEKLGMNALLGVGVGSEKESQLIVLQWMHGAKDQAPIAVVGKGVTFDTGGISIKPSNNMEDMKYDMAGSGVVLGLMKALALRKAKVNVVGVMGMVENMPSGTAQRPADVVVSMSGQTIEIINTDAEGRLVLADALWYTQNRFKPQCMVDLATLTGAITVALGHEYAGLFSNDDALSSNLTKAADLVDEPLWRLPMGDAYDKDINSDIADVKNTGSGRGAGSITAAHFLKRFVNDVPWAHLDIAGTAWEKKDKALHAKGATGYGVRLLNQFISENYE
jgi:leucyl aminopeptidase